jgi:hypothetical protein
MAMRRIWLALLFSTACLVEQPIEEETDTGSRRNHPPVIVQKSPNTSVLYLQRDCDLNFSLPRIDDEDLEDDLVIKWFVNYEDDDQPRDTWVVLPSEADGPARLLAQRYHHVDLKHYPDRSTVVVEAVVSDGFADPMEPPRNRAIAEGRGVAVATWTIVISEGSWCNIP